MKIEQLLGNILPEKFLTYFNCVGRTGSSWTCNPPVNSTDVDFICHINDFYILELLDREGWEYNGSMLSCNTFHSFKKTIDDIVYNLIITEDKNFYEKFSLATAVCKKLNLLNKQDRVDVHAAFLYNISPTEEYNEKVSIPDSNAY